MCDEHDAQSAVVTSLCKKQFHVHVLYDSVHQIVQYDQSVTSVCREFVDDLR
jgi:hypothetical protein